MIALMLIQFTFIILVGVVHNTFSTKWFHNCYGHNTHVLRKWNSQIMSYVACSAGMGLGLLLV